MKVKHIILLALTIVVLALLWIVPLIMSVVIMVAVPVALSYGLWAHHKMSLLENAIIEEHGSKIAKKDRFGNTEVEIDIKRPYTLTTPYIGYLEAIYRVKQNNQVLEFSTKTKDAEHLAKDVFKVKGEYPPIAPWNFGW
jgi:hypothetical protein